ATAADVARVLVLPHHPVLLVRAAHSRWASAGACVPVPVLGGAAPARSAIECIRDHLPALDGLGLPRGDQGGVEEPGPSAGPVHPRAGPWPYPFGAAIPLLASHHRPLVCQWLLLRGRVLRVGQDGPRHGALQSAQRLVRLQSPVPDRGGHPAGACLAEYAPGPSGAGAAAGDRERTPAV